MHFLEYKQSPPVQPNVFTGDNRPQYVVSPTLRDARDRSPNATVDLKSKSGDDEVEYRKLGATDIDVSVFSLGCWPFASGVVWGDQDDNDSIAAVDAALDAAITSFDTAEGYESGRSERVLGEALGSRRSKAVIRSRHESSSA